MEYAVIAVTKMETMGCREAWRSIVRIGDVDAYVHVGARSFEEARRAAREFLEVRGGRPIAVYRTDDPGRARA